MNIELPLVKEPIVKSLNCHAYITGILGVENNRCLYILSDYLDIVSTKAKDDLWCEFINEKLTFAETNAIYDQTNCFQYYKLKSQTGLGEFDFLTDKSHFYSILEKIMSNGYYLTGWYDEYYVKFRNSYKKEHIVHDYLIYGYSKDKQELKVAGYSIEGHYNVNIITYEDFHDAVMSVKVENNLSFMKVKDNFKFDVPVDKIVICLKAYLKSENWNLSYYNDGLCIYGIDVQEKVSNRLKETCEILDYDHDTNCFALLRDHKNVLYKLCQLLYEKGAIDRGLLDSSKSVYDTYSKIFHLYLKCMYMPKEKTLCTYRKMSTYFDDIRIIEKSYIADLINTLKLCNWINEYLSIDMDLCK